MSCVVGLYFHIAKFQTPPAADFLPIPSFSTSIGLVDVKGLSSRVFLLNGKLEASGMIGVSMRNEEICYVRKTFHGVK
jgi:hypothetical protein